MEILSQNGKRLHQACITYEHGSPELAIEDLGFLAPGALEFVDLLVLRSTPEEREQLSRAEFEVMCCEPRMLGAKSGHVAVLVRQVLFDGHGREYCIQGHLKGTANLDVRMLVGQGAAGDWELPACPDCHGELIEARWPTGGLRCADCGSLFRLHEEEMRHV